MTAAVHTVHTDDDEPLAYAAHGGGAEDGLGFGQRDIVDAILSF